MKDTTYVELLRQRLDREGEEVNAKTRKSAKWKALDGQEKRLQKQLEQIAAQQKKMLVSTDWFEQNKFCNHLRGELQLAELKAPAERYEAVKTVLKKYKIFEEDGAKASPLMCNCSYSSTYHLFNDCLEYRREMSG